MILEARYLHNLQREERLAYLANRLSVFHWGSEKEDETGYYTTDDDISEEGDHTSNTSNNKITNPFRDETPPGMINVPQTSSGKRANIRLGKGRMSDLPAKERYEKAYQWMLDYDKGVTDKTQRLLSNQEIMDIWQEKGVSLHHINVYCYLYSYVNMYLPSVENKKYRKNGHGKSRGENG